MSMCSILHPFFRTTVWVEYRVAVGAQHFRQLVTYFDFASDPSPLFWQYFGLPCFECVGVVFSGFVFQGSGMG